MTSHEPKEALSWSLLNGSMLVAVSNAVCIIIMTSGRNGFSYRLVLNLPDCPTKTIIASGHRDSIFEAIGAAQSELLLARRSSAIPGAREAAVPGDLPDLSADSSSRSRQAPPSFAGALGSLLRLPGSPFR